jgi:hypothetical protein
MKAVLYLYPSLFFEQKRIYIPSGREIQILFTKRTLEITQITKKTTP